MRLLLVLQAVAQLTTAQPSEKLVSINAERRSVESVVRELSAQAGVPIAYGDAVSRSQMTVTTKLNSVTLRAALSQVLSGTQLVARTSVDGKGYVIERVANSAQTKGQGTITGKVSDAKTGRGISGATVSLGTDTRGVVTDENGAYRLAGASAGSHMLTVRLVGYAKQAKSVMVGEGGIVNVDFKLEPSVSVLDQVVVTGTVIASELKSVPNAITVITAKQIEERGITRIDQLFRGDIPGLFASNYGGFNPTDSVIMFSRGATMFGNSIGANSSNPIKTYVDGIELANSAYLNRIDPRSIERIEILSGPQASTIYGSNAINGVMQIFTKRSNFNGLQVSLHLIAGLLQNNFSSSLTPTHNYNGQISGTENRWSYNVGASWDYVGRWTPAVQTQSLGVYGGGKVQLNKFSVDISSRYNILRNRRAGSDDVLNTDLRDRGFLDPSITNGIVAPEANGSKGQTLGLTLNYVPKQWLSQELVLGTDQSNREVLRTGLGFSRFSDTLLTYTQGLTNRTSQRYTSTLQLPMTHRVKMNVTVGTDHWRTRTSFISVGGSTLTGSVTIDPSLGQGITRSKPGKNTGTFLQGQLGISDALFLTYGLRAEWNPNYGGNAKVLPGRYGVAYTRAFGDITAKWRASYGRSSRPPTEGQKFATPVTIPVLVQIFGPYDSNLANPELGPEYQQGGEGGLELYLGNRGSLVVTRYNQTVDELIEAVFPADSTRSLVMDTELNCGLAGNVAEYCYVKQQQYINVGSIRNQGWELHGSVNIGPFTTLGTYSWTKSRVIGITPRYRSLFTSTQYQPGAPYRLFPEHTWAATISYSKTAGTISINLNGTGFIYRQNDENVDAGRARFDIVKPRISILNSGYKPRGAGYTTANMNASYNLARNIEALLQIQNLTNFYQNDFSTYYAVLGRQTKAGFRVRLN